MESNIYKALFPALDRPLSLALCYPAPECFPFIVFSFPASYRNLHLGQSLFEIDGKGDRGMTLARYLTAQSVNLSPFQEELSHPRWIRQSNVLNMGIGTDVTVQQEGLPFNDPYKTILQVDTAFPDRLDLCPFQGNPRLILVKKLVFMMRLAVRCNRTHVRLA